MNTKTRIKELIDNSSNIGSVAELERKLNIANGTINKWDKARPSVDVLSKVADYFKVSVDYLLCRENSSQIIKGPDNEIAEFYRKVTSDLEMNECEEQELKDDFKAYLQMRAEILKSKGKGK